MKRQNPRSMARQDARTVAWGSPWLHLLLLPFIFASFLLSPGTFIDRASADASTQYSVQLRSDSDRPVTLEIISEGFIKISAIDTLLNNIVLFEGRVQSVAVPRGRGQNEVARKALVDAGIAVFDVDSKSPKSLDTMVVLSNSAVLGFRGWQDEDKVRAELPVESKFDIRNMRLNNLFIDWKTTDTIAISYDYRVSNMADGWEESRTGTFIYRSPVVPGISEVTPLSKLFTSNVNLLERGGELFIQFKTGESTEYSVVRIERSGEAVTPGRVLQIVEAGKAIESESRALMVLPKKPQRPEFQTYLQEFGKYLGQQVLGQPEGLDLLLDIEKQNIINNGDRKAPEIGMFIGLPGTGKDTLVEAYVKSRLVKSLKLYEEPVDKHLFRMPIVKKEADIWAITGSGTGYVGSGKISPLNRFLILHAGGRYEIQKSQDGKEEFVVENAKWKPGMVLPGYFGPQDGAVYVNEFHDWSIELKNTLLKEALEKGYFNIGSPGPGLNRIQVPINIFLASNNGIGLITARDREGRRVGAPLTEEQMFERWKLAASDKPALKAEIAQPTPGNIDGGTSEEVLSRIPNSRLLLLRPLTKATVVKITTLKLEGLREKFAMMKAKEFPRANLDFTPKLRTFVASYDQLSEDGARIVDDKVKTLVEKTFTDAVFAGKFKYKDGESIQLSVQRNADHTYSLVIGGKPFLMTFTEKSRDGLPITDEKIDKLGKLETGLNNRVKGVEHIAKALARDIRLAANTEKADHVDKETKTADVYAFLGTSSTGKTELAVALHQILFETDSKPLVIDFSQIQTVSDLKEKILGFRNAQNKSVPSDFMGAYDRSNGKLVVVMDEISNANPEILKALYDLLREPVVRTFSDNKPRPMGQVKIVMTGNAGEEWYRGIPRDAPEVEQLEAARKIYEKAIADEGFLRRFLQTKFSEAFLNRIGTHRIFFFAPHTAKTTRELIQLKLVKAMKDFSEDRPGRRNWSMRFASTEDYVKTIVAIENYGFKLWEQGASITNFVTQVLMSEIHDQLLLEKIQSGREILIRKTEDKKLKEGTAVGFELVVDGGRAIPIEVRGKPLVTKMHKPASEIILTGYHESAHEIVNKVLLGDKIKSKGVSVLPGVVEIGGEWIRYEGLASHEQVEHSVPTRELILARLAVILAGEQGENLSTKMLATRPVFRMISNVRRLWLEPLFFNTVCRIVGDVRLRERKGPTRSLQVFRNLVVNYLKVRSSRSSSREEISRDVQLSRTTIFCLFQLVSTWRKRVKSAARRLSVFTSSVGSSLFIPNTTKRSRTEWFKSSMPS